MFVALVFVVAKLVKIVLDVFDKAWNILFEVLKRAVFVDDKFENILFEVLLSSTNSILEELNALLLALIAVLLANTPKLERLVIVPPVMIVAFMLPTTSSVELGLLVPIPTLERNVALRMTNKLLHRVVFDLTIRLLETYALPEISNVY